MKKRTSFTRLIQSWGIVFLTAFGLSMVAIDIIASYHDFNFRAEKIRKNYINSQKRLIKQEVDRVVDMIDHKSKQVEALTKEKIKLRAYEACSIAENIYQQNKNSKSAAEIQQIIIDALRPIRFEQGTGYYFIIDFDGLIHLSPIRPNIEKSNQLSFQDKRDQFVIKDMINITTQEGEGSYEYYWAKPNEQDREFKKISFVKKFEPYNWVIGTGLYVGDIEQQIKRDLLDSISRVRFGKEGYIFVNRLNGDCLVSNGMVFSGTEKLWEVFDENPQKTKEVFEKEYAAAQKPEGDYIYYSWQKLTESKKESPKTSFIYPIPQWQWLVGAGVYLDEIETDIASMHDELHKRTQAKILYVSLITTGVVLIFLFFFNKLGRHLKNDFNLLLSFFNKAAILNKPINRDLVEFDELDRMAESANKMLRDKINAQQQLLKEKDHLFDSEAKFRGLVESSSDFIWEVNADGVYTYASPQIESMLGYPPGEVIGKKIFDLMPPEEAGQISEIFKNLLRSQKPIVTLENINLHKDGRRIVFETSGVPFFNEKAELIGYRGIDRDITARKHAEQQIEILGQMTDKAPCSIVVHNFDGKMIYANQRTFEMHGYEKNEFLSLNLQDIDSPESFKLASKRIKQIDKTGEASFETSHLRKDGSTFPLLIYAKRILWAGNLAIMSIGTDITQQKQTQQELSRRQAYLLSVFRAAPIGIGVVIDRVLKQVNERMCEMTGYSEKELLGQNARILYLNDEDYEYVGRVKYGQIREKGTGTVETRWKRKDGRIIDVLISSSPVDLADPSKGVTFAALDITERKISEQEREGLLRTLEFKNRELQDIVYTASHDLRSPLVNIQGFSGELSTDCANLLKMLQKIDIQPEQKKYLEHLLNTEIPQSLDFIANGAAKMANLLDGLLRISRIGTTEIKTQPIDVNQVVSNVLASMEYQIKENDIEVTVAPLPPCMGDPDMLHRVFSNLLTNAIKYRSPARKCKINISAATKENMSIYCVEDNGIGIARDYYKKIFEIFHRLNPDDRIAGEGLGLTIVRRILERLNGRIWLKSKPEKGSRFYITLPAVKTK